MTGTVGVQYLLYEFFKKRQICTEHQQKPERDNQKHNFNLNFELFRQPQAGARSRKSHFYASFLPFNFSIPRSFKRFFFQDSSSFSLNLYSRSSCPLVRSIHFCPSLADLLLKLKNRTTTRFFLIFPVVSPLLAASALAAFSSCQSRLSPLFPARNSALLRFHLQISQKILRKN